jgi:hypothetical protein
MEQNTAKDRLEAALKARRERDSAPSPSAGIVIDPSDPMRTIDSIIETRDAVKDKQRLQQQFAIARDKQLAEKQKASIKKLVPAAKQQSLLMGAELVRGGALLAEPDPYAGPGEIVRSAADAPKAIGSVIAPSATRRGSKMPTNAGGMLNLGERRNLFTGEVTKTKEPEPLFPDAGRAEAGHQIRIQLASEWASKLEKMASEIDYVPSSSFGGQVLEGAAGSLPHFVGGIAVGGAATLAGGPVAGAAASAGYFSATEGLMYLSDTYDDLRDQGLDHDDARSRAIMATGPYVAASAVLEFYGGKAILRGLGAGKHLDRVSKLPRWQQAIGGIGLAGVGEGSTEVMQGIVGDAISSYAQEDWTDFSERFNSDVNAQEFIVGAILGGGARTIGEIPNPENYKSFGAWKKAMGEDGAPVATMGDIPIIGPDGVARSFDSIATEQDKQAASEAVAVGKDQEPQSIGQNDLSDQEFIQANLGQFFKENQTEGKITEPKTDRQRQIQDQATRRGLNVLYVESNNGEQLGLPAAYLGRGTILLDANAPDGQVADSLRWHESVHAVEDRSPEAFVNAYALLAETMPEETEAAVAEYRARWRAQHGTDISQERLAREAPSVAAEMILSTLIGAEESSPGTLSRMLAEKPGVIDQVVSLVQSLLRRVGLHQSATRIERVRQRKNHALAAAAIMNAVYELDGLRAGAYSTISTRNKGATPAEGATAAEGGVSVGDYVQWTSGGVAQFVKPRRVTGVSEDGEYVFVEGSNTGIPVAELSATDRAPVNDGDGDTSGVLGVENAEADSDSGPSSPRQVPVNDGPRRARVRVKDSTEFSEAEFRRTRERLAADFGFDSRAMEADTVLEGRDANSLEGSVDFTFSGDVPAELREALQGEGMRTRMMFSGNNPRGMGEDWMSDLGVDEMIRRARVLANETDPERERFLINEVGEDRVPGIGMMQTVRALREKNAAKYTLLHPDGSVFREYKTHNGALKGIQFQRDAWQKKLLDRRNQGDTTITKADFEREGTIEQEGKGYDEDAALDHPSMLPVGATFEIAGETFIVYEDEGRMRAVSEDGEHDFLLDGIESMPITRRSLDQNAGRTVEFDEPVAADGMIGDIPFAVRRENAEFARSSSNADLLREHREFMRKGVSWVKEPERAERWSAIQDELRDRVYEHYKGIMPGMIAEVDASGFPYLGVLMRVMERNIESEHTSGRLGGISRPARFTEDQLADISEELAGWKRGGGLGASVPAWVEVKDRGRDGVVVSTPVGTIWLHRSQEKGVGDRVSSVMVNPFAINGQLKPGQPVWQALLDQDEQKPVEDDDYGVFGQRTFRANTGAQGGLFANQGDGESKIARETRERQEADEKRIGDEPDQGMLFALAGPKSKVWVPRIHAGEVPVDFDLDGTRIEGVELDSSAMRIHARTAEKVSMALGAINSGKSKSEVVKNRLRDVIDWPELFVAYPQIASLPVKIEVTNAVDNFGGGLGITGFNTEHAEPVDMTVYLSPFAKIYERQAGGDPFARADQHMKQTLIHEIQHAIAAYEGWQGGSNTSMIPLAAASKRARDQLGVQFPSQEQTIRTRFGMYFENGGERLSRNTERRRTLTPEQRRLMPYDTTLESSDDAFWVGFVVPTKMGDPPNVTITSPASADTQLRDPSMDAEPAPTIERDAGGAQGQQRLSGSDPLTGEQGMLFAVSPPQDTRMFKRWFGESKAVDASGKPLVLYHGTPDGRFMDLPEGGAALVRYGQSQAEFFFTNHKPTAASYADPRRAWDYQNAEPRVLPVFLSLQNPMVIDGNGIAWGRRGGPKMQSVQIAEARAGGHDGIIIRNTRDNYNRLEDGEGGVVDVYVVFSSRQVKSATQNNGDFDPANPDIRYAMSPTSPRGFDRELQSLRDQKASTIRMVKEFTNARRAFISRSWTGADGLPHHMAELVSRETGPQRETYPWRVTSFMKRGDEAWEPWGHTIHRSRREAMIEAASGVKPEAVQEIRFAARRPDKNQAILPGTQPAQERFIPYGRPDLANPGETEGVRGMVDAADELRNQIGLPNTRHDARVEAEADAMMRMNRKIGDQLVERANAGEILNDAETVVLQRHVNRLGLDALRDNSSEGYVQGLRAIDAYRNSGTAAARAFRMRRDDLKSPAERFRESLMGALFEYDPKVRKKFKELREVIADPNTPPKKKKQAINEQNQLFETEAKKIGRVRDDLAKAGLNPRGLNPISMSDPTTAAAVMDTARRARTGVQDTLYWIWMNNILSGPLTHMANMLGNSLNLVWRFGVAKPIEGAAGTVEGAFGGDPDFTLSDWMVMWKSIMPSLVAGFRNMAVSWASNRQVFDEAILGEPLPANTYKGEQVFVPDAGPRNKVVRALGLGGVPLKLLMVEDQFFKSFASTLEAYALSHRQAVREGLKGVERANRVQELLSPTQLLFGQYSFDSEIWRQALDEGRKAVFQDDPSVLGKAALEMRNGSLGPVLKWIIPFVRTPDRIFVRGIHMSGIGALLGTWNAAAKGYEAVSGRRINDRFVSRRESAAGDIAVAVTSLAMLMLLYSLKDDEEGRPRITGSASRDYRDRAEQYRKAPPQSIRIGGKWYSYSRLEPFATGMAMTIDMLNEVEQSGDLSSALPAAGRSLVRQTQDKTFLEGVGSLIEAVEQLAKDDPDEERGLDMVAGIVRRTLITGWVPNLFKQVARADNPAITESRPNKDDPFWDRQLAGLEYDLLPLERFADTPRYDVWGRPIERSAPVDGRFVGFLWRVGVPINVSDDDLHPMDLLLDNYNERVRRGDFDGHPMGGEMHVYPPPRTFIRNDERVRMTSEEYQAFVRDAGRAASERLLSMDLNIEEPTPRDATIIREVFGMFYDRERERMYRSRFEAAE